MVVPSKAGRTQAFPAAPGQWDESVFLLDKPYGGQVSLVTLTSCLLPSTSKFFLHPSHSSPSSRSPERADRKARGEKEEPQGKRLLYFLTCSAPRIENESQRPSTRAGGYALRGERSLPRISMSHSTIPVGRAT